MLVVLGEEDELLVLDVEAAEFEELEPLSERILRQRWVSRFRSQPSAHFL